MEPPGQNKVQDVNIVSVNGFPIVDNRVPVCTVCLQDPGIFGASHPPAHALDSELLLTPALSSSALAEPLSPKAFAVFAASVGVEVSSVPFLKKDLLATVQAMHAHGMLKP